MSKQQNAKDAQGYEAHPRQRVCGNCRSYISEVETCKSVFGGTYSNEKNKRCTIGGFAVKKTAVCKLHQFKED